jgi:hypothetical protein
MTTTGELLVQLSDLSTGTALEHLLNITGGGVAGIALADFADLNFEATDDIDLIGDGELDLTGDDDIALEGGADIDLEPGDDLEVSE